MHRTIDDAGFLPEHVTVNKFTVLFFRCAYVGFINESCIRESSQWTKFTKSFTLAQISLAYLPCGYAGLNRHVTDFVLCEIENYRMPNKTSIKVQRK